MIETGSLERSFVADALLASPAVPASELVDRVPLQLPEEPGPEGEGCLLARVVTAPIVFALQDDDPLEERVAQLVAVGGRELAARRRARDHALDERLHVDDDLVRAQRLERRAGLGDRPHAEERGQRAPLAIASTTSCGTGSEPQ